jgi:hypothetical protein
MVLAHRVGPSLCSNVARNSASEFAPDVPRWVTAAIVLRALRRSRAVMRRMAPHLMTRAGSFLPHPTQDESEDAKASVALAP